MCGIAGLIGQIEPADHERVAAASCALAHRGPDADRMWASAQSGGGVILAHRRLSIIDLSDDASQPMIDAESGATIVFNGEIYNFAALRRELLDAGRTFRTAGDTEVIVQGYLQWGDDVVRRLRGMFAFVLYDPRRRRALFARDGHGIKPLYTAKVRGPRGIRAIAFASEVRALLATGLVARETDSHRVHRYLWNGFAPAPETMVRGIESFPPGSIAGVNLETMVLATTRYWAIGDAERTDTRRMSAGDAAAAIGDAVSSHLVADVKLGVFLSGGIDSSAVSTLAAASGHGQVETLSIGFDESEADESKIAAEVARRLGTAHRTVIITPGEMLDNLDAAADALDQPSLDGVNTWFVSRAARQAGWKVALAGTGGDELFGGYASFRRLPHLMTATRGLGLLGPLSSRASSLIDNGLSIRSKLADLARADGRPARLYQTLYGLYASQTAARFVDSTPEQLDRWSLTRNRPRRSLRTRIGGAAVARGQPPRKRVVPGRSAATRYGCGQHGAFARNPRAAGRHDIVRRDGSGTRRGALRSDRYETAPSRHRRTQLRARDLQSSQARLRISVRDLAARRAEGAGRRAAAR